LSPLGKYQQFAATLLAMFIIATAAVSHILNLTADTTFIDAVAFVAIGAVYGQQSASNGYAKIATAANDRLDAIGAPSAAVVAAAAAVTTTPPVA
jgi:hypothetical protein